MRSRMVNFSYKTAGLVTIAFSLTLLSVNVIFNKSNSASTAFSKILLDNLLERKSAISTQDLPQVYQGLPYLPEELILKGNIDTVHISMGNKSKIVLTENRVYSLGEEIKMKIFMYNARGEKMSRGGDYLRLWMETQEVRAAVSGKVMDNNDGTYSGTIRAMWTGKAVIGVRILLRREEISGIYQMYNKYHLLWHNFVDFANGQTAESSECSVVPYDKSVKWCNVTEDNYGLPWFCVEPKKPGLSCSMWTRTFSSRALPKVAYIPILAELWKHSKERDFVPKIPLGVTGWSDRITSPDTPCNRIAPEVTWDRKSPNGFFYGDKWHSTQCTDTMVHTPTAYRECLRGRTLYLHGDSTARQFIEYLFDVLGLDVRPTSNFFNKIRTDTAYNFTLSWVAHELPYYNGRNHFNKSRNVAQHIILDKIPPDSRDIIIVYIYVHFTFTHPDVYRVHIRRMVQSIRKLITRAPGVTIVARGPHAFTKMNFNLMNSYWGLHYTDILHEEYALLQKNVLFLDYWDMSMARLPGDVHPPPSAIKSMVQHMMSVVCNRK